MTAWLTWLSAVYTGAPGYHAPKANNSLYLSKEADVPQNALVSNAERWEGIQKKITACSIACFVGLWCCEHSGWANPPPHAGEPKRMESREPWSRNLKAENRNHGIFIRRYQASLPGFPVYVGASKRSRNSHIIGKVSYSWPITTTMYTVPDTITDCSTKTYSVSFFKVCLWYCYLLYLSLSSFTAWNWISGAVVIKQTQTEFLQSKSKLVHNFKFSTTL